jgi:DNA polymerase
LDLIEETEGFRFKKLQDCHDCKLRESCQRPVEPSSGKYNVMVVGEAPGIEEDQKGIGFVGRSGQLLWQLLEQQGIERKDVHVTNTCKCFPGKNGLKPSKAQIAKCSQWLRKELKRVRPTAVLALGNTPLQFFKNQESGIMNLTGTTEWSRNYNCWVCWCIHPASALYAPENKTMLKDGIKNFGKCLRNVGWEEQNE